MDTAIYLAEDNNVKWARKKEYIRTHGLYIRCNQWLIDHNCCCLEKSCLNCKAYPIYKIYDHRRVCSNCFCIAMLTKHCFRIPVLSIFQFMESVSALIEKDLNLVHPFIRDCCYYAEHLIFAILYI